MDALAGYGSDSSSSFNNKEGSSPNNDSATKQEKENEGLSGLLASYTDDEDNDEDDVRQTKDDSNPADVKGENKPVEPTIEPVVAEKDEHDSDPLDAKNDNVEQQQPPQKKRRRRRWDNKPENEDNDLNKRRSSSLPLPLLSKSSHDKNDEKDEELIGRKALILFDIDYTAKLREPNASAAEDDKQKSLIEKLDKMHQTFYSASNNNDTNGGKNGEDENLSSTRKSFATHLKSKKEFGNPHMFPSVIAHFGIDSMGTNLSSSLWDPKEYKDFEYFDRISAAELQARERAAEQRALEHASQQQADQQVQMAMGGAAVGRI